MDFDIKQALNDGGSRESALLTIANSLAFTPEYAVQAVNNGIISAVIDMSSDDVIEMKLKLQILAGCLVILPEEQITVIGRKIVDEGRRCTLSRDRYNTGRALKVLLRGLERGIDIGDDEIAQFLVGAVTETTLPRRWRCICVDVMMAMAEVEARFWEVFEAEHVVETLVSVDPGFQGLFKFVRRVIELGRDEAGKYLELLKNAHFEELRFEDWEELVAFLAFLQRKGFSEYVMSLSESLELSERLVEGDSEEKNAAFLRFDQIL